MAHHSSDGPFGGDPETLKALREMMKEPALEEVKKRMLGPTDRRPEPALGPNDEGELRYRVGTTKDAAGAKKVVVDFGSPVHSLGLTKAQACELGRLLINRAGYICTIRID